jgi:PmbA protein
MSDRIDLEKLQNDASRLVTAAIRAGADACDCIVAHGQSLGISVRDGKVEDTNRAEADDFSLRVFCGHQVASISANALLDIDALAARAVAMARVSPEDPYQGLAPQNHLASTFPQLDLLDEKPADTAGLTEAALACESGGLAVDGVSKSLGAGAGWGVTGFVLATSGGFEGQYCRSRISISAGMVAGDGVKMERDHEFRSVVHVEDLPAPVEIGRIAGERAVRRLNPRQIKSGRVPVVFDRRVSAGIAGALAGAINGASVARGTSFLRNDMGKRIASPSITLRDDPLRLRGLGSRPFDGEGMPVEPIEPVRGGMLECWLLDWATGRELGLESNGRAGRTGSGTSPSTTNCYIEAGTLAVDEMIGSLASGLLVTETIGHGVNMVTGDYSKGASGFWIENGELAFPVSEITIAGNLRDMFANMTPASDLQFRHATNAPTLLVEGMTVGGK